MKKRIKGIICIVIMLPIMTLFSTVYGANTQEVDSSIKVAALTPSQVIQYGDQNRDQEGVKKTTEVIVSILSVVQVVALAVATGTLLVVAIQYMRQGAEGKAAIKQKAVVYVIGAIIAYGAAGLIDIYRKFVEKSVAPNGGNANTGR